MQANMAPESDAIRDEINIVDYLRILSRRRLVFIQTFFLVLAVGVTATLLAKPVYRTEASFLVIQPASRLSLVDATNPISALLAAAQPDSIPAQLQVLQSAKFLERARESAKVRKQSNVVPPEVRVQSVPDANVIKISVEGGDPSEIARFANTVLDTHLGDMDMLASGGLRKTTEHIRKERTKSFNALVNSERELVAFRSQHRILQLQVDQSARSKEYVDLQAKVRAVQSNIAATKAQVAQLEGLLAAEPLDLQRETLRENPRVQKLRDRLGDLELERVDLLREYKPDSPRVKALDSMIAEVKGQLAAEPTELPVKNYVLNPMRQPLETRLAELRSSLEGYQADYNVLSEQLAQASQQVDQLTPVETQLARLERDREMAQSAYSRLSERLQDLEIRSNADMRLAREVERAYVPTSPIRPRKALNIALSLVLGVMLAAGMAFLQEFLDDRISSPDDLQRLSPVPALGHVPRIEEGLPALLSAMPMNSRYAEVYRVIRSGIAFAGTDAPLRVIQVTSASQGEGKTLTSLNIATAMAMDGKKIVLIDADLRRPSVHRRLGVSDHPGLSDVLANIATLDEAIQATNVENLFVIPAGTIPPNPAELLGSKAFEELLRTLEERMDVVLVDSPPCLPVADPAIIAARVDGVIMVIDAGRTKKAAFRHAESMLHRAHARMVGVVFNRISQDRSGYYYYYHYYYHGSNGYYNSPTNGSLPARAKSSAKRKSSSNHLVATKPGVRDEDEA